MSLKRWLYGLPIMSGYRGMRTSALAAKHRDHPLGFRFAGYDQFFGEWELVEQRMISDALCDAEIMIDVGANIGFYTCLAAQLGKIVVAIEPEPGNLRFLLSNVAENGFDVEIYPVAMADGPSVIKLYGDDVTASAVPDWCGMTTSFVQLVPGNSLDNLFADRWPGKKRLIKIDVEGFERAVMDGANRLIHLNPRPTWLIECFPHHFTSGRPANDFFVPLFERMFAAGYEAISSDTGEKIDMAAIIALSRGSARSVDEARSNFLFHAADRLSAAE